MSSQVLSHTAQHHPHLKDSSTDSSSSGEYHSAQTISRYDTNSSVLNNNIVEPYPSAKTMHKNGYPEVQELQSVAHPEPHRVYDHNGDSSLPLMLPDLPKPQTLTGSGNLDYNNRSSSSLPPQIPDTPVGATSFDFSHMQPDRGSETSPTRDSPSSNAIELPGSKDLTKRQDRRSKSVDLSHLYLLDRGEPTHFTLTNESMSDVSQNMIKQYLGEQSSSSLVPRMKTLELYKKNVKKSNDPRVLFQYAQYMLQTALTMETDKVSDDKDPNAGKLIQKQFLKEAVHYLKKLADKGYNDAQYLLADAHSSGALGKIDNGTAFSLFQSAAKHGHIESAYRTAYCYEEGLGVSRDARRAIDFLKFAASKNHPAAMYKLGLYSWYSKMGLSDNVNVKKNGIQWLSRATEVASELTNGAPFELAKIHQHGFIDIIIPDLKYAMELYIQAASLGHIKSAAFLGNAYELGNEIVETDANLSIHYYTQAALGGDAESMLSLCAWYLVGNEPNLPKDEYEAFQWALRSANMRFPKAQLFIANCYERGIGCEANKELAIQWYQKASKNGMTKADNKLKKLLNEEKALEENASKEKKPATKKRNKKSKDCVVM